MKVSIFTFDEKTHRYYLDGKPMTGVTTVLGVINKPALINWAANQACDYASAQIEACMQETDGKPDLAQLKNILEQARTAHSRKRDTAAEAGTDVHAQIEDIIKTAIQESDGLCLSERDFTGKQDTQVSAFIQWAISNGVRFTASEKRVYSVTNFTAGTLDFACEIDGLKYIGDIKTTSGIYDRTPFAQTAAYQMMMAEMEGKDAGEIADRRIIVNLKKTGTFDADKDVYVSTFYEDDIELFMSALTMYRNVGRFAPLSYQHRLCR